MKQFLTWLFQPGDTGAERAAKIFRTLVLPLGVAVLGVIAVRARSRPEDRPLPVAGAKATKEAQREKAAERVVPHGYAPSERKTAVPPSPEAQVAQAMDLTVARGALSRLRYAVAQGDTDAVEAAGSALSVYPPSTFDVLERELLPGDGPEVRKALEQARKNSR